MVPGIFHPGFGYHSRKLWRGHGCGMCSAPFSYMQPHPISFGERRNGSQTYYRTMKDRMAAAPSKGWCFLNTGGQSTVRHYGASAHRAAGRPGTELFAQRPERPYLRPLRTGRAADPPLIPSPCLDRLLLSPDAVAGGEPRDPCITKYSTSRDQRGFCALQAGMG